MQVTCPEGHQIEISDPTEEQQLVGVFEDGTEGFAVRTLSDQLAAGLTVKCNAMVVRVDGEGRPSNEQCGAHFTIDVSIFQEGN